MWLRVQGCIGDIMELSQDQIIIALSILLGVSELVALSPKFKSNSVLQLLISSIKRVLGRKKQEPEQKVEDIVEDLAKEAIIEVIEEELEKIKK